jgi:hypothetical protein
VSESTSGLEVCVYEIVAPTGDGRVFIREVGDACENCFAVDAGTLVPWSAEREAALRHEAALARARRDAGATH